MNTPPPQIYNAGVQAAIESQVCQYFADPVNGLQYTDLKTYKIIDTITGTQNPLPSTQCLHTDGNPYTVVEYFFIPNNNGCGVPPLSSQYCTPNGCFYSTWKDLIDDVNLMGVGVNLQGSPFTMSTPWHDVRSGIAFMWGCTGSVLTGIKASTCVCIGTTGCVDPGDGSGTYLSLSGCESDINNACYTGTTTQSACDTTNCVGSITIPDTNFEQFLETHESAVGTATNAPGVWPDTMGNGTVGDNLVLHSSICCTKILNVSDKFISDLTGIASFTAVEWLQVRNNQLTSIDVSSNLSLVNLDLENNQLTSIDVTNNPSLYTLSIQQNQFTSIDLSQNFVLDQLICYHNQITTLDFSNNLAMRWIWCWNNNLTNLDVSMLPLLRGLRCGQQNLGTLDLSNNPDLFDLDCGGAGLSTLDLSIHSNLHKLNCHQNNLTSLDISNNPLIQQLTTGWQQIGSLDVSIHTGLTRLHCYYNGLTSLDLSNNTDLSYLECSLNSITTLDLSLNTSLSFIRCNYSTAANSTSQLTTLNLGSVLDLNNITTLELTGNANLTIHVGTAQRVIDFNNIFLAGTHYEFGTTITI